ncbi:MAG: hypothetical protein EA393_07940 [Bacteroidetes bacterium]|nr:MAG: hypothetical protein EA393_07940 [Bacteroidota bacterium]
MIFYSDLIAHLIILIYMHIYFQYLYLMIAFLMLFCCMNCDSTVVEPDVPEFFIADYDMNNLPVSNLFEDYQALGPLNNPAIDEASGIAVSRKDPDLIWTHNDSGDMNRIFLIQNNGIYRGAFRLLGAGNRDWEDMAIGPGLTENVNYLYIAEIGDNLGRYPIKYIYRLPEPDISLADSTVQWVNVENVDRIPFVYPDGIMMDAETLMIDPWTKDLYIITKREYPVTVYKLPYPQSIADTTVAVKYGTLPFTWATAGDISADGKEILVKTLEKVFLWARKEGETISDAFMRQPVRVPYTPEIQGEAIAFPENGSGYYTLSESRGRVTPVVYFYKRKE